MRELAVEPFRRLARLVARAFFQGPCPPSSADAAASASASVGKAKARIAIACIRTDGLASVLVDYLATKDWVGESLQ